MTSVLIRCDASLSIGSGHVMRCRTLARELQRRGSVVSFLCRRQSGDLIDLLEQEFAVLPLPEQPLLSHDGLTGRDLYRAWLGCSQVQDADDCLQALGLAGIGYADWLVVDHYGLDASWESLLLEGLHGEARPKLLVIDDLADRLHKADLLVDQNFFGDASEARYEDLLLSECRQLLGPHYALLGSEYHQCHQLVPERTDVRRVLVFFGGVDPENLTGRTIEALMDPELAHLAVDVVLGRQSPHRQSVTDLVVQRPLTTLHGPLPSLAGLISRADLAIGAVGATTWERACLKLPSLVVSIAENQVPFAKALHQAGHLELLGDADEVHVDKIRSALLARIANFHDQKAGGNLTDGFGASRLSLSMLGPQVAITLRPADASDESLLLRWANDFQVSDSSFFPEWNDVSCYQNWFRKGLVDLNSLHLIATLENGCPIGQVRFDRQPLSTGRGFCEVVINWSLDRSARGFGLSDDLVRLALHHIEKIWSSATQPQAELLMTNQVRNVYFFRAGVDDDPISAERPLLDHGSLELPPSRITLLSDSDGWLDRYLPKLIQELWRRGHVVRWIHHPSELVEGDVCLLLSCGRLLSADQLALHRHNLVVHESALPQGQGWSPMTWQILDGANCIPVTLFEAVAQLDAGKIYLQQQIDLQGLELVEEWRSLQAKATIELCLDWLDRYKEVVVAAKPQLGEPSHYRRRRPADSELDPDRSLSDQFNLLRIVDNRRYPTFFNMGGRSFYLHVFSEDENLPKC